MENKRIFPSYSGGEPFVVYGIYSEQLAEYLLSLSEGETILYSQWKVGVLEIDSPVVSLMTTLDVRQHYSIYDCPLGSDDTRSEAQRDRDDAQANNAAQMVSDLRLFLPDNDAAQWVPLVELAVKRGHTLAQTLLDHPDGYTAQRYYEEDFDTSDEDFEITDGVLEQYLGTSASVTVPADAVIGRHAFENCSFIRQVQFTDDNVSFEGGIESTSAFWGCTGLADQDGFIIVRDCLFDYVGDRTDVVIPDRVKYLANYCFARQIAKKITIPHSVVAIGELALHRNMKVTFAGSVPYMPNDWTAGLIDLKVISGTCPSTFFYTFEEDRRWRVHARDDMYILGDCLVRCESTASQITVPEGVKSIASRAFFNKHKRILLPEGCEYVAPGAVRDVQEIYLPASIRYLGKPGKQYLGKPKSQKITIFLATDSISPEQIIENFETSDFVVKKAALPKKESSDFVVGRMKNGGVRIKEYNGPYGDKVDLQIPDTIDGKPVCAIGQETFARMAFRTVTIPDTVELIEERAFQHATFQMIRLPASLKIIGTEAFAPMNMFAKLAFADLPESVEEVRWNALKTQILVNRGHTKHPNIEAHLLFADCEEARKYKASVQTWHVVLTTLRDLPEKYAPYKHCLVTELPDDLL